MANTNVQRELEAIRKRNGGLLTEEAVIKAAKSKTHPLHNRFTWDDTEAAKQWRLEEARMLIRSVHITIEQPRQKPVNVRAYASLPSDREGIGGFRRIEEVMTNKALRKELLASAFSELESLKRRYANLSELIPVFDALDSVKAKTKAKTIIKSVPRRKAA